MIRIPPIAILTVMIKEKACVKLRHELKYDINPQDDLLLSSRLRKLLRHDGNADSHGFYRVSSLYFDTPHDKALRQKIDGVNCREKFRLRYYRSDISFIRLEKKFKRNGLCGKYSVKITKEQVRRLLAGDAGVLLESEEPLYLELYSKMRGQLLAPKTIVSYEREAFFHECGNVRITLDRNLHTGLACTDFLNAQISRVPLADVRTVLEIKYDEFLPEFIAMAVQLENRQAVSCSKYALCRRYD